MESTPDRPAAGSASFQLALVSMPWALFNRPSVQLGSLGAYIRQNSTYQVSLFHPFLNIAKDIGLHNYQTISLSGWAGEALFTALLFPEKKKDAERLFQQTIGKGRSKDPKQIFGAKSTSLTDFHSLTTAIQQSCDRWISETDPSRFRLIGLSICFYQLLPSLYLAKKIKEYAPSTIIVAGGTSCCGEAGRSLLKNFPQLDCVVDGEGEETLVKLCDYLNSPGQHPFPARVSAQAGIRPADQADHGKPLSQDACACPESSGSICSPGNLGSPGTVASTGNTDSRPVVVDTLPLPDYTSYFQELDHNFPQRPFSPVLPVEFSRGCWWNRCTFCNLNLQLKGYRSKSAQRMSSEIMELSRRHEALHFSFTDNALPTGKLESCLKELGTTGLDFDLFGEIRGEIRRDKLTTYRQGGLKTVQVGIESFSSSLLRKMDKGTSAMDNVAAMKQCAAAGITLTGNLITEFPGSSDAEVAETLRVLDYVLPFAPLDGASFFLGLGSPIAAAPKKFRIQAICHHQNHRALFPKEMLSRLTLLVNSYRGDRGEQRNLWQPVRTRLEQWRRFHDRRDPAAPPPLHYLEGGSFLIIRQLREDQTSLIHRLRGVSRELYLFCDQPRTKTSILERFPKVSANNLDQFLAGMTSKRLMFTEEDKVLSLAIPLPRTSSFSVFS